jgi:hypothetical protein
MAAWPGGSCPDCGEDVPARVVRCRNCGALLNPELAPKEIEPPEFVLLPEVVVVMDISPRGFYVGCPSCERELRIAAKYVGQKVACRFCEAPFVFDLRNPSVRQVAVFADCPRCQKELRAAVKYLGKKVGCKFCNGPIRFVSPGADTA